jgi:replicative superfamily II helicase
MVDLSRFRGTTERPSTSEAGPVDPEAIFRRAPKGASSFPDLWRGQTDALRQWHTRLRAEADVLIALNTGGGKTVVGTLIAQSLINEGLQHVVYACGTIDLVRQTAKEASRLGLGPTLRIQQKFSDDRFETVPTFLPLQNGTPPIRNYF